MPPTPSDSVPCDGISRHAQHVFFLAGFSFVSGMSMSPGADKVPLEDLIPGDYSPLLMPPLTRWGK